MFYVLTKETEETVAMTRKEDVAIMIAAMTAEDCIIRRGEK